MNAKAVSLRNCLPNSMFLLNRYKPSGYTNGQSGGTTEFLWAALIRTVAKCAKLRNNNGLSYPFKE
jgi:hypothetical protein